MNNPTYETNKVKLYAGSNLEILPTLPDNSVDSIVTDPPYELGFMNKTWDSTGIAYSIELWRECLRVLKPGGHLLAFGGTRTWHRLAVAVEDAGFEIRDNIAWLYGSGFPKSHNISKAIDKAAGAEREVIGKHPNSASSLGNGINMDGGKANQEFMVTASATDDAKKWDGWGTALKPAHEPIVVARKPLIGTVAENVLTYGTGAININATRIGTGEGVVTFERTARVEAGNIYDLGTVTGMRESGQGRWPANIILDEYTAELLDEQSGMSKDGIATRRNLNSTEKYDSYQGGFRKLTNDVTYGGQGGASRFFYVAKANKRDRNEGLDELPEVRYADRNAIDGIGGDNPRNRTNQLKQNFHPTVKPTALMQYLIRLVTPDNGIVLDPFTGSGSTGKAAILEGKQFIGIELTEDYLPIIIGRLKHAEQTLTLKEDDLFE